MRDRELAANSHCTWEEIRQNHNKIQEVSTKSRRNLKRNTLGERKQIDQNVKKEKRFFCINRVNWTPNPIDNYKAKVRTPNP